jgi:hypothetical protein
MCFRSPPLEPRHFHSPDELAEIAQSGIHDAAQLSALAIKELEIR